MKSREDKRDFLTGVYSREYLAERAPAEVERASRQGGSLSLLFVDVDYFKSINDAFTYAKGDQVLAEAAQRIIDTIRDTDLAFRYGGDEFVILLPQATMDRARASALRLVEAISSLPFGDDPPLSLTISTGVSSFPDDGRNIETLLEKADLRLHEAKRRGRNCVVAEAPKRTLALDTEKLTRPIEWEENLGVLHQFLEALHVKRRGILLITGPPGSGGSRFIEEVEKAGRLRGLHVMALKGSPVLKTRPYGALFAGMKQDEDLFGDNQTITTTLEKQLVLHGKQGILVLIENLSELDGATLEFLQNLIRSTTLTSIAFVCSADLKMVERFLPVDVPLRDVVELRTLSRHGVAIWLRTLLQWEPPESFVSWLFDQTGGLPSYVRRALEYLVERSILEKEEKGWSFTRDFGQIPLRERLGVEVTPPPHNLPVYLTSFVGRHQEVKEVTDLLGGTRLITIVGTGGVGKTRLAIQAAAEKIESFLHGVYFVPLATLGNEELLCSAIAESVEFSLDGPREHKVQLMEYLREKEICLIMDNFEHLVGAAGTLTDILTRCQGTRMLVTSRVKLNVEGETIFELRGMKVPSGDSPVGAATSSAVQLFLYNARRVLPGFSLLDEQAGTVVRICQLVDGLPLAIELAAAWLRVLSCEEIAGEVQRSLDILASSERDRSPRHRSLRAAFDHSWKLLTREERIVLAKLSQLCGGFGREAADRIAGASLVMLSSLIDKSLLTKEPSGRYRMLVVIRQYAADRLQEMTGKLEETRDLHAAYYSGFLQRRQEIFKERDQKGTLNEIGEEIENIRSAWRWVIERRNLVLLENALEGLFRFLTMRGWFREGAEDFGRAAAVLREDAGLDDDTILQSRELLGRVLSRQASFYFRLGDYSMADRILEESWIIIDRTARSKEAAFIQRSKGNVALHSGDYSKAREFLEQSLAIGEEREDESEIAASLQNLGQVCYRQGEIGEAARFFEKSLEIRKRLGDMVGLAWAMNNLGSAVFVLGRHAKAKDLYRQSLEIRRAMGHKNGIAMTQLNLGMVAAELGAYAEAEGCFRDGLSIYREIGGRWGIGHCIDNLGYLAFLLGENQKAKDLFEEGHRLRKEIGDRNGIASSLFHLGLTADAEGRHVEALELFSEGLSIRRDLGDQAGTASCLGNLSSTSLTMGRHEESREYLREALTLSINIESISIVLEILVWVASYLAESGAMHQATECLSFALFHDKGVRATRDTAERLMNDQSTAFSVESDANAWERVKSKSIAEIAERILQEI